MIKISTLVKGSICLLGLFGANILAAPANAGQAAARAAATVTRASGTTESVSGEVLLPNGSYFQGVTGVTGVTNITNATLIVAPTYGNIPGTTTTSAGSTSENLSGLLFSAGNPQVIAPVSSNPIINAVATILSGTNSNSATANSAVNAKTIEDAAAIIKAAGGVNGLGGLE